MRDAEARISVGLPCDDDEPDPARREACLKLYADVVYFALYHETGAPALHYVANAVDHALQIGPDPTNQPAQASPLNSQLLYFNDGQNIRQIGPEDVDPFLLAPQTDDLYYLAARTMLNGILSYARDENNPLMYFGSSFNSTLSNNFLGNGPEDFCGGPSNLFLPRPIPNATRVFQPVCLQLNYWARARVQLTGSSATEQAFYSRVISSINQAIFDAVMNADNDPTNDAIGFRPVNRVWLHAHPNQSETAFTFRTYITRIVEFTWEINEVTGEYITSSPTIYSAGETLAPSAISVACQLGMETIAQAYMRNLQTIYGNNAFLEPSCTSRWP